MGELEREFRRLVEAFPVRQTIAAEVMALVDRERQGRGVQIDRQRGAREGLWTLAR